MLARLLSLPDFLYVTGFLVWYRIFVLYLYFMVLSVELCTGSVHFDFSEDR